MKPSNDREAITLIMQGLAEHGIMPVSVNYGDGHEPVSSIEEAVEEATAADEANVLFSIPAGLADRDSSFIYFVLGNDPEEVACDYGVSLSPFLDPIVEPWWE